MILPSESRSGRKFPQASTQGSFRSDGADSVDSGFGRGLPSCTIFSNALSSLVFPPFRNQLIQGNTICFKREQQFQNPLLAIRPKSMSSTPIIQIQSTEKPIGKGFLQ